jgi:predicted O-linked N-acetylglucosamine transferase (SPINDLY family)
MGLGDLVARSEDEYLDLAAKFAADDARLTSLRSTLRARFLTSPIGDELAWVRHWEAAVSAAWQGRVAGGH